MTTRPSHKTSDRILFGSPAAQELLADHRLASLDDLFERRESTAMRHEGRSVFPVELTEPNGAKSRAFVKLHWGRRRLWPRMNDIKAGQVFQSHPMREWRGIERLEALGIGAPERLALLESRGWSLTHRAAVIVREVPAPRSVDELLQSGEWNSLSQGQQEGILHAMVGTLRRLHAARLGWRGASSRHFYPLERADGAWAMWLIDCEGIHPFAGRRTFARNFDKLSRAMRESGADDSTLERLSSAIARRPDHRRAA